MGNIFARRGHAEHARENSTEILLTVYQEHALVVYDLFREFSQPTLKHRSLFCCLSSREQIPERLTALLALQHLDVPLLAPPLLLKALQEVRRPDKPPERLGKRA